MTHEPDRGDGRKLHYGEGRQPIDDIIEVGWAPEFYAGNILKYLRRNKEVETSHEKAIWYWNALTNMARTSGKQIYHARAIRGQLISLLTDAELALIDV